MDLPDLERAGHAADGAVAHAHAELAGLDHPLHATIVEAKLGWAERERHAARDAGRERHPLESLEFEHRPRDARHHILHVELNHLVTLAGAGVAHRDRHVERSGHTDAGGAETQIAERERRVTEAMPEGKERRPWRVEILRGVLLLFIRWTSGGLLIVVQRFLPHRARERHRQMTAWIHRAEDHVSDGIPGLGTWNPRLDHRSLAIHEPGNCQWTAVNEDDGGWLGQGHDGFGKLALPAGQIERGA